MSHYCQEKCLARPCIHQESSSIGANHYLLCYKDYNLILYIYLLTKRENWSMLFYMKTNNPDIVLAQILFTFSLQVSKNSTNKLSFHNLPYWFSKETEESMLAPSSPCFACK